MTQLSLFAAAPVIKRPARPDTAMLLAMSDNAPPRFAKQATGAAAAAMLGDLNRQRDNMFCLSTIKGHEIAIRAAEIAITGRHSLAIYGGDQKASFAFLVCLWNLRCNVDGGETGAFINHIDEFEDPDSAQLHAPAGDDQDYGETETSAAIMARICATRQRMAAPVTPLAVDEPAQRLMAQAIEAMQLDWQAQHDIRAVANTIAHMAGESAGIRRIHIAEAISYRRVRA